MHGEALRIVASPLAQQCERFLVFHAFGDAFEVQRSGKLQDRPHDLLAACVLSETPDKAWSILSAFTGSFLRYASEE